MDEDQMFRRVAVRISEEVNLLAIRSSEEFARLKATNETHAHLLEMLYANVFLEDAAGFDAFIRELIQRLQTPPAKQPPATDAVVLEALAEASARLENFRAAVHRRIAQAAS